MFFAQIFVAVVSLIGLSIARPPSSAPVYGPGYNNYGGIDGSRSTLGTNQPVTTTWYTSDSTLTIDITYGTQSIVSTIMQPLMASVNGRAQQLAAPISASGNNTNPFVVAYGDGFTYTMSSASNDAQITPEYAQKVTSTFNSFANDQNPLNYQPTLQSAFVSTIKKDGNVIGRASVAVPS